MSSPRQPSDPAGEPGPPEAPARPAIPDGGLGTAMPEWLQQSPAWKRPAPEVAQPRSLPQPDTSPIDPRTMLALEDLPEWLQAIAARSNRAAVAGPGGDPLDVPPASLDESEALPSGVSEPSPDVAKEPPAPLADPETSKAAERPWWMSDPVMAALLVAVVLTLIYVVLVASGAL